MGAEGTALPPLQPHLRALPAYVTGRSALALCRERGITDVVELASNENPLGPSPRAVAAIGAEAASSHLYPDSMTWQLRERLAAHWDVDVDMVLVTNGAEQALTLLAHAFLEHDEETLMPAPSFPVYRIATIQARGTPVEVPLSDSEYDLGALVAALTPRTRLVYVANPNNPTGTYLAREPFGALLSHLPQGALVVLDEAYREYTDAPDAPEGVEAVRAGEPVAVLRTFSKAYGLAGLRVGYLLADPAIVDAAARVRETFAVNRLAQAAALAALEDEEHLHRTLETTRANRARLSQELHARGLPHPSSQANYVWVDTGRAAAEVWDALIDHGVVVRSGALWQAERHLRVTVGTEPQVRRFLTALDAALEAAAAAR